MRFYVLVALFTFSIEANAGARISTYLEGKVLTKTVEQWVVQTSEGTYWIKLNRPLSWLRKRDETRVSFWVAIDQIARFRPAEQLLLCKPEYQKRSHDSC